MIHLEFAAHIDTPPPVETLLCTDSDQTTSAHCVIFSMYPLRKAHLEFIIPHVVMKESKFLINIYPNPAKDLLRVSLSEEPNIFSYSIFNVLGIEIMKGRINDKNSDISIKDLNKGVYLILLGGKTIKFIKE